MVHVTKESQGYISVFDGEMHSCAVIAAQHLLIRRWQEGTGENKFIDIVDSQSDLQDIPSTYIAGGGQFFVASTSDHRIVGFCGLQRQGAKHGQLKGLAVEPASQGKGIGSRLVGEAVAWAKANGWQTIELTTGENERAEGVYLAHGFEIVGFHETTNDIVMRWSVGSPAG